MKFKSINNFKHHASTYRAIIGDGTHLGGREHQYLVTYKAPATESIFRSRADGPHSLQHGTRGVQIKVLRDQCMRVASEIWQGRPITDGISCVHKMVLTVSLQNESLYSTLKILLRTICKLNLIIYREDDTR